jgi:hypothetical protein
MPTLLQTLLQFLFRASLQVAAPKAVQVSLPLQLPNRLQHLHSLAPSQLPPLPRLPVLTIPHQAQILLLVSKVVVVGNLAPQALHLFPVPLKARVKVRTTAMAEVGLRKPVTVRRGVVTTALAHLAHLVLVCLRLQLSSPAQLQRCHQ